MKASEQQVGGNHYRQYAIQPSEFCQRNNLNWCEANAIKYVARHRNKNGRQDIEKAIHYLNLLLEWEYPELAAEIPQWFSLRLPTIQLSTPAEGMRSIVYGEIEEHDAAESGSENELIEAWDVRQAAQTWLERQPCTEAEALYNEAGERLRVYFNAGRDVMKARWSMLAKNAMRHYYSPEDNNAILHATWRPE